MHQGVATEGVDEWVDSDNRRVVFVYWEGDRLPSLEIKLISAHYYDFFGKVYKKEDLRQHYYYAN